MNEALSTAQAAGTLFDRHVIDHYRAVLRRIDDDGFYPTLRRVGRPHLEAAWANFAPHRRTFTERSAKQLAAADGSLAQANVGIRQHGGKPAPPDPRRASANGCGDATHTERLGSSA